MPPVRTVFKTQGAQDDFGAKARGDEFKRTIRIFSRKWALGFALFFSVCAGASPLLMNVIMGDMMNVMTQTTGFLDTMSDLCLKMLYVIIAMVVVTALSIAFRIFANPAFMVDLRYEIYKSLMEQEIGYYDETPTGILVGRLSEDVTLVRETYIDKFLNVVQNLAQAVAGLILGLCTVWRVCLAVFPGIPLSALVFLFGEMCVDKLWLEYNASSTECSSKAEEVISQFRTVKAFDNELLEAELYSKSLNDVYNVYKKVSLAHGVKDGLITLFIWGMIAGLIYYICWIIVRQPYLGVEPGDMMILMMSMMLGTIGISTSLSMIDDFKKAGVSAAKIVEIIDRKPAVDRHEGANDLNGSDHIQGKVEFRDVGFKYSSRDDYAVRHLSFIINAGETVALVGESGCGKSTTLQLLQRFYEVNEGAIYIDDVDIRTLSPTFVRSQISIVPQGPVLFSMSIRDNVRYAKPHASDQEVAEAATVGNAHDFIMELPQNYETIVQQTSLSGGQKQRICISRAILMNSPILLLDEATAALDTESEQLVQQSLERTRHGRTAIVVAHRLATVMNADRILVFKDGHIEEKGTHQELLAAGGIYSDLVRFQLE